MKRINFILCFYLVPIFVSGQNQYVGTFTGNGGGLTNLRASNIVGTFTSGLSWGLANNGYLFSDGTIAAGPFQNFADGSLTLNPN